jgi:hypothetical protein
MTKSSKPATHQETLENDRKEWTRNRGDIQSGYLARLHETMHHRDGQPEY